MYRTCVALIITVIIVVGLAYSTPLCYAETYTLQLMKELSHIPSGEWIEIKKAVAGITRPEAHLIRAAAEINLGNLDSALGHFETIGSATRYNQFARQVISSCKTLLAAKPSNLLYLNCLAFAYYAIQQLPESAEAMEKIMVLDPENVWIMDFAAFIYGKMRNIDRGLKLLRKSLEIDPANQYTHFLLSMAYFEKGNYLRSIYHYLHAPEVRHKLADRVKPSNPQK